MTSECVVDAELFKRFCLESGKCDSCQGRSVCESSFVEVARCLIVKGQDKHKCLIQECGCLENFLEYVETGKCTIYYNDHIRDQYADIYDKLPIDLTERIQYILSIEGRSRRIPRGKLEGRDLSFIDSTPILKAKKHYLDVATHLQSRKIISTQEDKISVYKSALLVRLTLVPSCVNICEEWDEIWEKIKVGILSKEEQKAP